MDTDRRIEFLPPIEVLTPIAACVLFGRSIDAVRTAAKRGHVASRFSMMFNAKQTRFLDLRSAVAYWGEQAYHATELEHFRHMGFEFSFDWQPSQPYRVLHPYPLIATGDQMAFGDDA